MNPLNYFSQDEIDDNGYIIEEKTTQIFASRPEGGCGVTDTVVVCANKTVCIYWQKNLYRIPYRDLLLATNWIGKYILWGGYIMDSDPTQKAFKSHTGKDGITRKWIIEANSELCYGYGGAAYNGRSWCALSQDNMRKLTNTVRYSKPTIPQVIFYEVGRCLYNLKLDDILDWQMEQPEQYGYWTLGYSGAMTAIIPELIGCNMDYYGQDAAAFKAARLQDLNTYVTNSNYNFQNTWSSLLLPWNNSQSINDLMSGLLIYLYDNYGGATFLYQLFHHLLQQPSSYSKIQREDRARNLVRSCYLAVRSIFGDQRALHAHGYFYNNLRWRFVGTSPTLSKL